LEDGPVLVVTSNGIARFALQVAEPGNGSTHELKLKTGAFGRIDLDASGAANVVQWNIRP
ncbi:MAG: histidine phosphatase family protein, partial [Alphaproteobacteria bacterium]|nr:histidine phosphatase family protein [Alphaproteobacteria bacterium]